MDITYSMIGADGQQYGPVTQAQLLGWVREGRITPATQILRSDVNFWLPAAQYTELGLSSAAHPPALSAPTPISQAVPLNIVANAALIRRARSGASWFYWIGGFSLINALVLMSGKNTRFIVGLGITDIIAALSQASAGMVVGMALDFLVLAVFVMFGVFAHKGHSWSYIAGMVCYAADACLFLLIGGQIMNLAFHGLVLVFMFLGLQANMKLNAMRRGQVA